MKTTSTYLLFLLLAIISIPSVPSAQAQGTAHEVRGTVVDAQTNERLIGVNVLAEGTTLGTVTNEDGAFVLRASVRLTSLTFSYLGYKAQTLSLADQTGPLNVRLEPTLVDLQPVIVSASRSEQARSEAPVAIATITARKLEETKPTMLYQALNQVAGVHMVNLGSEQHTMSIRQPIQYKALFVYLEDGVPIRPIGVFNHNALIEINMAGVERIEVIRGPSSAFYGSNAVGGAVNFLTPRPTRTPTGYANIRADNYGYRRADFNASSTFGKLGVYVGGYGARQRDGWADHTDFDKVSVTLRADYDFSDRTRLVTTLSTNHLDTDMRGELDSLNFFGKGYSSLQTFTYRTVDATRVRSTLSHTWDDRNSTDVSFAFRDNAVGQLPSYRVRDDRSNPARATGEINESSFTSYVANVQHKAYFGAMDAALTAGASIDYSPNSYYARFLEIQRDGAGRYVSYTDSDSLLTNYDVGLLNTAAYAQFEFEPMPRLRLVSALRYDRIDYDYDNFLPPSSFSGAADQKNGFNRLSPKVGLTYDFGQGRGLYANYSLGFIPPEVGELYRGVQVPTLAASTFNSYEVGGWAALVQGRLYVDWSLYRMDGDNEIISVQLDDGSRENANAGQTRHTGVEYALVFKPVRELSLRLGGTNARHEFIRFEDRGVVYDGNEMDRAPNWILNAEATYRPSLLPGSRIALEWQHLGPYYMDFGNTIEYSGYDLLHLRVGYEIRGVELWTNIENLTNELFANVASRSAFGDSYNPGAARNVIFGVGYNFGRR